MSSILQPLASPMISEGMQGSLSVFNNGGSVDSSMDADIKDIQEQIEMYRGRGVYSENRQDKSDVNPKKTYPSL